MVVEAELDMHRADAWKSIAQGQRVGTIHLQVVAPLLARTDSLTRRNSHIADLAGRIARSLCSARTTSTVRPVFSAMTLRILWLGSRGNAT